MTALIEIPTDRPRAASRESACASVETELEAALRSSLVALAARHGIELPIVLLAGWFVLVHRLSAQSGLLIAVATGGRMLPLRLDLLPMATAGECLAQVDAQLRAAQTQADVSPGGLADASGSHAWQLSFHAQPDSPQAVSGTGSELAMGIVDTGEATGVRLEYDEALFDASTAQRYLGYWRNLLEAMVADDGLAIDRLAMISAAERLHLLEGWNETRVDYPQDQCLHALIETQVARTPDAVAVVAEDLQLSYTELNARANRLAHHLRALGVRPDDRVGICVERGWQMMVGLLAILKSGGAYVPLDPAYPADRLRHMLQDSAPTVLLTQAKLAPVVEGLGIACPVLDLSVEPPTWAQLPATNPSATEVGLTARHLAYTIYTSGSTGLPKGAMIEHRSVVNRLLWIQDNYRLDASDTVLQKAPISFDASVTEFFWPLMTGARLVMARPEGHKDPAYLSEAIRKHKITTTHFVPSMLHAFLEESTSSSCATALRRVMCGGEALPVSLAERFQEQLPGVGLFNQYGPTETAITVTYWPCAQGTAGTSIPIGRPIANTRIYVLDAHLEPVPQGVAGELYIGGVQVGRGYLNRDELTAERFLRDPFAGEAEARMYRTGDLGRWLPDGNIEYLGRNDFQVKIRGFRIELGEIEARLHEHPDVSAAVVLARGDDAGDMRLVAYYVPRHPGTAISVEAFHEHLGQRLPDHMVPALYVRLDALPVTPNGKLDRRALPEPGSARPDLAVAYEPPASAGEIEVCAGFSAILKIDRVGRHDNFFDLGGNSLLAMRLLERLRKSGTALPATVFFRNPTPATLAAAISGESGDALEVSRMVRGRGDRPDAHNEPIAIVAMTGRFPGAADVDAFWRNLCEGRDTITLFKPGELDPSISPAERNDPSYVAARGIIDGLEQFDAAFFGISPREAELMDPQQRIFLELCWECLERGGYAPDATPGPVGVFAGMNHSTYFQHHVSKRPDLIENLGAFQVLVNNEKGFIATRVAHKLNLTGPAITVHTACSTSLVAICQAMDSLRAGRCDMALAGAASATCPPRSGYRYQEGGMLSADGHTRTFDADASGTTFSDGAAVVLLKRLSDAQADGDQIFALIRGGAINNDGGHKASFTAPSSEGQAAVIAMAHENAGVSPRDISYVEAHGTATPLGDPIEIEGLAKAFRRGTADTGFCRIGSVKSNVGHLIIAAGAAGVIKTALAMTERRIPPMAHFKRANPAIDFASTPFVVNTELTDWEATEGMPRLAGVSAFGVGGTNAHVVMEEAPVRSDSEPATGPQLLALSARTPAALAQAAVRLADHLDNRPDANLADVAWTLATGRKAFAHRLAVAADDVADAVARLRSGETASAAARSRPAQAGGVVFMFPGQGSQYAGMGRELYANEPVFRTAFDECAEGLFADLRFDLRDVIFGGDAEALLPTSVMQPAIFSLEYSLAKLWMGYGIAPVAMVGHSVGEFVAAALSGVFSLADALKLVARRGRLMQAQPPGSMLSVRMPLAALQERLPPELSLAAENAPGACVVSGPDDAVARFQAQLEAGDVACRVLHTSHAFHSAMMDPVVEVFRTEIDSMPRAAPRLPLVSTATGEWLDADDAVCADYWARHLREPVRFSAALKKLIDDMPGAVLLEVGSRTTLAALARQHQAAAVSTLSDSPESEVRSFRQAMGLLWARGLPLDPSVFDRRAARHRVLLPTYPFERQAYWIEAAADPQLAVPHPPAAINTTAARPELHLVAPLDDTGTGAAGRRRPQLVSRVRELFEDATGFTMADPDTNFIELGLDSLVLTQIALRLQKVFGVKVTFRQLMGECATLHQLAEKLDSELPADSAATAAASPSIPVAPAANVAHAHEAAAVATAPAVYVAPDDYARQVVDQQMALMQRQLALLEGSANEGAAAAGFELKSKVIEQQQALMARQLDFLAGALFASGSVPREFGEAAEPGGTDVLAEAMTMDETARKHGVMDARYPVVPGARLGRDPEGRPAWFVANPELPGRFLKVGG
ncbi:MAG TPA: amino acid adenylation domain-containing protein [Pseudoxanthomonas sp.]